VSVWTKSSANFFSFWVYQKEKEGISIQNKPLEEKRLVMSFHLLINILGAKIILHGRSQRISHQKHEDTNSGGETHVGKEVNHQAKNIRIKNFGFNHAKIGFGLSHRGCLDSPDE
jgi:hypothetical protein